MNPKVSVVIATFRRNESLDLALSSLGEQSYSNFEIVLVDDNADAEWNAAVLKNVTKFRKAFPNIELRLLVNDENLGSAETRNKGIFNSDGQFVTFLDDDDVYLPNKISNQVRFMVDGDLDFAVTDLDLYYDDGSLAEHKTRKYIQRTDSQSLLTYHLMYHITGTDTMMFKRDYLVSIGAFPPIDIGDEFYLMLRSIENGGRFGYLPTCDVRAIVHRDGTGLSGGDGKIKGENKLYEYKKQYFGRLDMKAKRYIRMRHHAVLAFAQKRRGKTFAFIKEGIFSVLSSPIACAMMLKNRRDKAGEV
ncbi:MAG: glycosyltransferase family 2 protein [Clostridia bacterium]|nr:glycosyltransferase family 2 protein [Clostridia bacterium]